MTSQHSFFLVDAFTCHRFGGNQAAVILANSPIGDEEKQKLGAEFNLSETAFPEPKDGDFKTASHFGLRWFTPTVEIDLCGHATLATAHVLFNEIGNTNDKLTFTPMALHHGDLIVSRSSGELTMDFPQYKLVSVDLEGSKNSFSKLFPSIPTPTFLLDLVKCLIPGGLPIEGIVHSPVGKKLMIILSSSTTRDQFGRLLSNYKKLLEIQPTTDFLHGIIVTFAPTDSKAQGFDDSFDYICRFFCVWSGVDEDPATGSAQCALGPLWRAILKKEQLQGYQAFPGRGAEFKLSFPSDERVLIQGKATTIVNGTLHL